jgi:uncharacterized DUF497 family protein
MRCLGEQQTFEEASLVTFEGDENKRSQVLDRRGVNFAIAALIVEGPVLTVVDDRMDYGDERLVSIGRADGEYYVVVHTARGERTRVVTAWKASRRQRAQYQARYPRGTSGHV